MFKLNQCDLAHLLEVHIVGQLHIFSMDTKNLQTTSGVRDTDIDFTIETAKSSQCGVNRIRSVRSRHDHNIRTCLHAVHQREQLRHDTTLDFSIGLPGTNLISNHHDSQIGTNLFTLGSNRIDFINEDNCGRILLGFLKCLPQITLTLTSHFAHDLRAIDQEEESARLVRNCPRHKCLTGTRWSKQEDTARRLDTDRLE